MGGYASWSERMHFVAAAADFFGWINNIYTKRAHYSFSTVVIKFNDAMVFIILCVF